MKPITLTEVRRVEVDIWNPAYNWHNPAGLTPAQVGVKDGWRLALKSEIGECLESPLCQKVQKWESGSWTRSLWNCNGQQFTYRTQEPLPQPRQLKVNDRIDEHIGNPPVRIIRGVDGNLLAVYESKTGWQVSVHPVSLFQRGVDEGNITFLNESDS